MDPNIGSVSTLAIDTDGGVQPHPDTPTAVAMAEIVKNFTGTPTEFALGQLCFMFNLCLGDMAPHAQKLISMGISQVINAAGANDDMVQAAMFAIGDANVKGGSVIRNPEAPRRDN